jgi:hypothetical protein
MEREILAGGQVNVAGLLLLEARPAAPFPRPSDGRRWPAGRVRVETCGARGRAWDFAQINRRYARHLEVLDRCPAGELADAGAAKALRRWAADEREAWLMAVQSDALLPERLLPAEYPGRRAWEWRKSVLGRTGERLRTFAPQPMANKPRLQVQQSCCGPHSV